MIRLFRSLTPLAVLLFAAPFASAGFLWIEPNWQLTPTINITPPNSTASIIPGSTTENMFSAHLQATSGVPPFPPGGEAVAFVEFTRGFTITGGPLEVPFRFTADGTVYHSPSPLGTNRGEFYALVDIIPLGSNLVTFGAFAPGMMFNVDNAHPLMLPSGNYQIHGAFSAFGRTQGFANVNASFGVDASPVPLPPLALPAAFVLGVIGLRLRAGRPRVSAN